MEYKTAEEILKQYPLIQIEGIDVVACGIAIQAIHEFHNQFQTPARKVSVEDAIKEYISQEGFEDSMDKMHIASAIRYGSRLQSSQPQPNAISVIEDYKEDLDKELRGSPSIQFVRDYQVKSQIINDLLTKLKP